MIFNNNTTYLNNRFSADTNYTPGTGFADMLIESARNDLNMFKAMLNIDARELQMVNESGTMTESQIAILQEASIKGIFGKIAEMFKKLGEKLKGIFKNFIARIQSKFMDDAKFAKKYQKMLIEKEKDLKDCTFKWSKMKKYPIYNIALIDVPSQSDLQKNDDLAKLVVGQTADSEKALEKLLSEKSSIGQEIQGLSASDYSTQYHNVCFDDQDNDTLYKDLGIKVSDMCQYLIDYKQTKEKLNKNIARLETQINKIIKDYETASENMKTDMTDKNMQKKDWNSKYKDVGQYTDGGAQTFINQPRNGNLVFPLSTGDVIDPSDAKKMQETAYCAYKKAQVYNTAIIKDNQCKLDELIFEHKQIKAALVKAVTYSPKTEAYATALSELAADEVENIFDDWR